MSPCNVPPFAAAVLAEASRIAPGRRTSSDGVCGDAAHRAEVSDHNPSGPNSYAHAVDVSHGMPGAPYWDAKYQQFNAHAYGDQIAERMKAGVERRIKYLVSHNYQSGAAKVWSLERPFWHDQPGDDHGSHLHISFTVGAEQSVAPLFGYATPPEEDDMTTDDSVRQILKQAIGGASMDPKDPDATVVDVIKHYTKDLAADVAALKASVAKLSK